MNNKKDELIKVLERQDQILDEMLCLQGRVHDDVMDRNWVALEEDINNVRICSDSFVEQDEIRASLVEGDSRLYYMDDVSPLFTSVRTKLTKSKVENDALATYVNATRSFIDGVLTECIPQERNVTYSPKGIKKSYSSSVVLNKVF